MLLAWLRGLPAGSKLQHGLLGPQDRPESEAGAYSDEAVAERVGGCSEFGSTNWEPHELGTLGLDQWWHASKRSWSLSRPMRGEYALLPQVSQFHETD